MVRKVLKGNKARSTDKERVCIRGGERLSGTAEPLLKVQSAQHLSTDTLMLFSGYPTSVEVLCETFGIGPKSYELDCETLSLVDLQGQLLRCGASKVSAGTMQTTRRPGESLQQKRAIQIQTVIPTIQVIVISL